MMVVSETCFTEMRYIWKYEASVFFSFFFTIFRFKIFIEYKRVNLKESEFLYLIETK